MDAERVMTELRANRGRWKLLGVAEGRSHALRYVSDQLRYDPRVQITRRSLDGQTYLYGRWVGTSED